MCYSPRIRDMVKVFSLVTQSPGRSFRGSRGKSFPKPCHCEAVRKVFTLVTRSLEAAWKKMESIRYPVESFPQQAATTSPWISFCTDKKRNTAKEFCLLYRQCLKSSYEWKDYLGVSMLRKPFSIW